MLRMGLRYFEDFAVGDHFAAGPVVATQEAIIDFAREFDPQPFHIDPAAAMHSLFGGLAASGWHTAALTMRMIIESDMGIPWGVVGLGVDELRWFKPVRPGDRLRLESEVVEARPSASKPDRGTIRMRSQTLNQDDVPVMSFVSSLIVPRRPGRSP
jgi:acyl dehydratase